MGIWGDQQPPIFILRPHLYLQTNQTRKLTYGTLVGICRYYGSM